MYCRTHNIRVCLYIAYIVCGSASLYIKTLYFFLTALALSASATVANIKIRYDAKTPQFAIFGTRVICVFYSICSLLENLSILHLRFKWDVTELILFLSNLSFWLIWLFCLLSFNWSIMLTQDFFSDVLTDCSLCLGLSATRTVRPRQRRLVVSQTSWSISS